MACFRKIVEMCKKMKVIRSFLYCLRRILGFTKLQDEITKLQEEVSTLYYFMDLQIDPQKLPKTNDEDLRILQDCDTLLLGILDKMCKRHGLTYWIEYGTLLGAVRHGGFIPWDDDTDVAMPRADFEKAYDLMHDELARYGITLEYGINELAWLQLHYRHRETGIWIDISPMDTFVSPYDLDGTRNFLSPLISKYIEFFDSHVMNTSTDKLWEMKQRLIFSNQTGQYRYLFHGQEFRQSKIRIFKENDLIPCSRLSFNGIELNSPANPCSYLLYVYGDKFMNIPHRGIEHHGLALNRPPLSKWAKIHGVNMQDVYKHLQKVYEDL